MRALVGGVMGAIGTTVAGQTAYRITDLTELAASLGVEQSEARHINDAGRVVGFEVLLDPEFTVRAIVWEADGTPSIPDRLEGDNSSAAMSINEAGQALGVSDHVTVKYQGDKIFIYQDEKPVLWNGNVPTNLRDLVTGGDPLTLKSAWDMNSAGWIVGHATVVDGFAFRGFLLKAGDGMVTDLGLLDRPIAINEKGQIVGWNTTGQRNAYLWDSGVLTNLHDDPAITGVTSDAWDINENGWIVGEAQFHISQPEEATLWRDGGAINLLDDDYGRPQSTAFAVNNRGQIVGYVVDLDDLNDVIAAFIVEPDGTSHELLDLCPGATEDGWEHLFIAWDVNEKGQIVGAGMRNGQIGRAFVLDPVVECAADCDGNGGLDLFDFLCFVNLFNDEDPAADCDGDGGFSLFDFLCFVNLFNEGC
jgi:probable HAF family extracellular repeat protein